MATTKLIWHSEQEYTGTDSRGNSIAIGGENGAKPSDLLPISLVACAAYTLMDILRKQRQSVESAEATVVSWQDDEAPWKFQTMDVHFVLTGDVDQMKAEKALKLAHETACSVSATLEPSVKMTFTVEVK